MDQSKPVSAQLSSTNNGYELDVPGLDTEQINGYDYRLQKKGDDYIVEFLIDTQKAGAIYSTITVSKRIYHDFRKGVNNINFT